MKFHSVKKKNGQINKMSDNKLHFTRFSPKFDVQVNQWPRKKRWSEFKQEKKNSRKKKCRNFGIKIFNFYCARQGKIIRKIIKKKTRKSIKSKDEMRMFVRRKKKKNLMKKKIRRIFLSISLIKKCPSFSILFFLLKKRRIDK